MLGLVYQWEGNVVDAADVSPRLKTQSEKLARCPELCDCQSWVASRYGGFHFPSGSSFSASEDNHPNLRSKLWESYRYISPRTLGAEGLA